MEKMETKFRDITGGVLSVFVLIADVNLFATIHNAMGLTWSWNDLRAEQERDIFCADERTLKTKNLKKN